MKILEVGGDGDYAAAVFETHFKGSSYYPMWEKAWSSKNNTTTLTIDGEDVEIFAYEFSDIDPRFIKLMQNEFIDYDDSKNHNFYIVEKETHNDNATSAARD